MRGVVGDESVSLEIGGSTIETWTTSTSMQNYTVNTSATGELRVAFTNDDGEDRDVQVDYVSINGNIFQAEDQPDNTGAYDGECGGGSYSEMLHCDGSIGFGFIRDDGSRLIVAINAGGQSTSLDGIAYQADRYASGGSTSTTSDAINGTNDDTVFQSERYGEYSYRIPVTEGTYSIALQFAEIYHEEAGQRAFNVLVEGQAVLSAFDLFSQVGHDTAYTVTVDNVPVSDGELTISLETLIDNGTLAGVAVHSPDGSLDATIVVPTGFFVGNITTRGQVRSDFIQYWDQITPENEGKWGSVERTRDQYDWTALDRIYQFARDNNIPVKAHTLVWGSQCPGWVGANCSGSGLSAAELRAEIEEWIRDYCTRYPDTQYIDVVNEATPGHAPAGYAEKAFGSNWITRSFELAAQYCPNATLILNDYNVLSWNTSEFIQMARPAVNAGVVDAIGLQAHGLADWSTNELATKLDQIAALGLPIYISEYDIQKTNDQEQLAVMQEQFPLFYNHPSVAGITIWGYVVGATWREGTGLIQSDGTPRPAMTWLMNYLDR